MTTAPLRDAIALLLLACTLTSCLRIGYRRERSYEAPEPAVLESLGLREVEASGAQDGTNGTGGGSVDPTSLEPARPLELTEVLSSLGAPLLLWPLGDEGYEGAALVWAWSDQRRWNLNASAPLVNDASGSLEFESGRTDLDCLVLFFDNAWSVQSWRRGKLASLLPGQADTYF